MAVITIGKGKQYSTPYYAAPFVKSGDTVEIYPGTYSGAWFWGSNITIKGMGPGVVLTGQLAQGKGLLVLTGTNVTVENITFKNANNYTGNGSGIRFEGTNLTVLNSTFLNNQDGILTAPNGKSTITVKNSTFDGNGSTAGVGAAHGIYAGMAAMLDIENSTFTNTQQGHAIKSRAKNTVIKNNSITDGPTGTSSYLIDIPNGGAATITGNYLEKGPLSSNASYAITLGEEGATNPAGPILIANNTYVNDDKAGVVFAHNQTGNADFTVANNTISGLATTLLTGKGTIIDPNLSWGNAAPSSPTARAKTLTPDFNADGKADILLQNKSGQVVVWTMNGTAPAACGTLRNPGSVWKVIAGADFNGDGRSDVVMQNNYGDVKIWSFNGIALIGDSTVNVKLEASWHALGAADFNGDGKADLLFQNADHRVWVWLMDGAKKTASAILDPGKTWNAIAAGDFNKDGKSDILLQNASTGGVQIWMMNGTTVASKNVSSTSPGVGWKAAATGDFDGDGGSDILFQNAGGQAMIWQMNGAAVKSSGIIGNPGAGWAAIGTGDYNGDGKDDILFQNGSGQNMVWAMNGLSVLSKGAVGNPGSAWHAVAGG